MKEAFGGLSTDWKEGINWASVRKWRLARAREAMSRHGLGARSVKSPDEQKASRIVGAICEWKTLSSHPARTPGRTGGTSPTASSGPASRLAVPMVTGCRLPTANTAGLPGLEWLAAIDGTVGEVALLPG
jgi:hypothetical protein